jgi:type II secretory pathway pseudopilin PulG
MKKTRQNGFVLILVIVAIAVIGIQMSVLADIANTMQFQSQNAYLKACERNLLASGLVWAKENVREKGSEISGKTIQLDVSKLNIRDSALDVTISIASDEEAEVQINTTCSRSRQTLRETGKYRIELNDQQETTLRTRESPAGN